MPEEFERRRGVDPLLVEVHGMLSALVAKFEDHLRSSDQAHEKLEDVDRRLHPLEDFHGSMKTAGRAAAVAGAPILIGIGTALWAWIKNIIAHTKVPQ